VKLEAHLGAGLHVAHTGKQQRGQQGIGISAAAMYGQLTTGKPLSVISRIGKKHPAHYVELKIDTNGDRQINAWYTGNAGAGVKRVGITGWYDDLR